MRSIEVFFQNKHYWLFVLPVAYHQKYWVLGVFEANMSFCKARQYNYLSQFAMLYDHAKLQKNH